MCKSDGESVNQLLIHCPLAFEVWGGVASLFGMDWVPLGFIPFRQVVDLFKGWHISALQTRGRLFRRLLPFACGAEE